MIGPHSVRAKIALLLLAAASVSFADALLANLLSGDGPCAIAIDSIRNRIYVANNGSNSLTAIDGNTNASISITCPKPCAVAVNSRTDKIYAVGYDRDTITVVDGSTKLPTLVKLWAKAGGIAVNSVTNIVYISNPEEHYTVTMLDGATNTLDWVYVGRGARPIVVNELTNKVYTGNQYDNNVSVIDGFTRTAATIDLKSSPGSLAINAATNRIYAACGDSIAIIDGSTTSVAYVNTGDSVGSIAINGLTGKIYVTNPGSNSVTVIDGTTNATSLVKSGSNPGAIAVNGTTNKVYVANSGGNSVTVIDGATNTAAFISVGENPNSIAINSVTNRVYVTNGNSSSVSVIDGSSATPRAPVLAIPSNGSTGVNILPAFSWIDSSSLSACCLEISTSASFNSSFDTTIIGTSALLSSTAPLFMNTTYFWHVYAKNQCGSSPWSSTYSFTTGSCPHAVALLSPALNAGDVAPAVTLAWTTADDATCYTVQVSAASGFETKVFDQDTPDLVLATTLSGGSKYYWRVCGNNAIGKGPWSSGSFTTGWQGLPGAVTLALPASNATNVPPALTFSWSSAAAASKYTIQVATTMAFNACLLNKNGTFDSLPAILPGGSKCYWRVCGTNPLGLGPWSVDSFTTGWQGLPGAVTLLSPGHDGSTSNFPTLSWSTTSNASAYNVRISTNANFNSCVYVGRVSGYSLNINLVYGSRYYWRVSASNSLGNGPWVLDSFRVTSGVRQSSPRFSTAALGVAGVFEAYSLRGCRVLAFNFPATATRKGLIGVARRIPARGIYQFRIVQGRNIIESGRLLVR